MFNFVKNRPVDIYKKEGKYLAVTKHQLMVQSSIVLPEMGALNSSGGHEQTLE